MDSQENGKKVLLVEDTLTQALLMQHQLKKVGYLVKLARSAKAALDELAKESFDIILSDINMPGMDGYELCKELKANESFKQIPFILLATPVEKSDILKMLASGAENFILKTLDENSFLEKLSEIMKTIDLRKTSGSRNKTFYAEQEVELAGDSANLADFLLSSFEMYLFQLSKNKTVETK
ncbi:MAG: response regulator [Candidatus Obscuribacterales bacterium]|nr:response regulator [Candidatus Obscuribacterales bacterium]